MASWNSVRRSSSSWAAHSRLNTPFCPKTPSVYSACSAAAMSSVSMTTESPFSGPTHMTCVPDRLLFEVGVARPQLRHRLGPAQAYAVGDEVDEHEEGDLVGATHRQHGRGSPVVRHRLSGDVD